MQKYISYQYKLAVPFSLVECDYISQPVSSVLYSLLCVLCERIWVFALPQPTSCAAHPILPRCLTHVHTVQHLRTMSVQSTIVEFQLPLASENLCDVKCSSVDGYIGTWNDTQSCIEFNVPHKVHDVRGDYAALGNMLGHENCVCHTWQLHTSTTMCIDEKHVSCLRLVPKHIMYSASTITFAPFHQDHIDSQTKSMTLCSTTATSTSTPHCPPTNSFTSCDTDTETETDTDTNRPLIAMMSVQDSDISNIVFDVETGKSVAEYASDSSLASTRPVLLAPRADGRELVFGEKYRLAGFAWGARSTSIIRCQPSAGLYTGRRKVPLSNFAPQAPICVAISSCGNVAAAGSPNRVSIWRRWASDPLRWANCESVSASNADEDEDDDDDEDEDEFEDEDMDWRVYGSFVNCLAFSADGSILAVGEASGKVTLLSIDVVNADPVAAPRPRPEEDGDAKDADTLSNPGPAVQELTSFNTGAGSIAAIDISNNSNTASTFKVACVARSGATVIAQVQNGRGHPVQILHSRDCEDLIDYGYEATSISFSKCNSRFIVGITHDRTQHISGKVRIYNCRFISDMMLALLIGFVSKTQPCADPDAPIMRLRKNKLLDVRAIAMVRSYL
jgi:hypothetical protein